MALRQQISVPLTLLGDGASTAFAYAVSNLYQSANGYALPFGSAGVVPSAVTVTGSSEPVTSATVYVNGNITITFTTAPASGELVTLQLNIIWNSGAAVSSSPSQTALVTLSGASTVTISGTSAVNLTQLNTVALGSPSNYGTSPGAVAVQGVNAFITNTVPVTLTSTTITGTVAVTQSTSPWVVAGGLTHNNAAPAANNVGALVGVASSAAPTYTTGDQVLLSTDLSGNLRVTFSAASEQNVNVNQWAGTTLGTPANYGTSPGAVVAGSVNAFVTNTVATTLASTTITGTVAVTQSTSPWVVSLASTTITGTVAVTQSTSPWVVAGALTNNNAAPTATLIGVLPAIAETAYTTVTYTTGDLVLPVTDLHGALNQDLQAVAGVQLGATAVTAFGTAPAAANVPGVNASIYAGTTGLTAAAKGTQGTNALTVQDYKDSGRTYVTLFADAVNSTITDALITFQYNKGGTVTTGVTNYQVTAGKTLRIQSISVAASASGSTVQCKFRVRSGAATLSATSPILWGRFQASNASLPGESTCDIPDGLEIAAAQQIGISGIQLSGSAGNTQWTISIVGFEY